MTKKSADGVKETPIPSELNIKVAGVPRKIVMTFGLKNLLAQSVGSIDEIQIVMMEVSRSNDLVDACIALRDESGNVVEPYLTVMHGDIIDDETYQEVLSWAIKHVMRFFIKRAKAFSNATETLGPELQALYKQVNGLAGSLSKTQ